MCFALAPIHILSLALPDSVRSKRGKMNDILWDTMRCIKGKRTEEEAKDISSNLWKLIKAEWPEYIRDEETCKKKDADEETCKQDDADEETCKQEDAAEFILKFIERNISLYECTRTDIETVNKCSNLCCPKISQRVLSTENVIRRSYVTDEEKESLQSVVDRTLSLAERSDCRVLPYLSDL